MVDVHDAVTRSRNMAAVRRRDTGPELNIRHELHRLGFRYRVDVAALPGRPDIVFPKYHAVLFVHGCFWHRHECHLFRWPATRRAFWEAKLLGNCERDARFVVDLTRADWRVGTVWECALRGPFRLAPGMASRRIAAWLTGTKGALTVSGEKG